MDVHRAATMPRLRSNLSARCVQCPSPPISPWFAQPRCECVYMPTNCDREQERLWLVWMSCILVGLSAAITTPFLWRGFQWVGEWARVSSPVWQVGFMVFWISPALAASLIFLARGVHLTDTNGTSRG